MFFFVVYHAVNGIICRSNVFIDGVNVVDNDGNHGSAQSNNAQRYSIITLAAGLHNIYIEGWAQSSALSMSATYQGPDTSGQESLFKLSLVRELRCLLHLCFQNAPQVVFPAVLKYVPSKLGATLTSGVWTIWTHSICRSVNVKDRD